MNSKIQIHPNLLHIASDFNGILLDAYGVFWGGNDVGLLPGAKEAMEKLVAKGKVVGILSNTTQLSPKEIAKLEKSGLTRGKHFHFLITAGDVARDIVLQDKLPFKTPNKKFILFGGTHPKFSSHQAIFHETSFKETESEEEADFIFISVPHLNGDDQTNPDLFREAVAKAKKSGLPMVCANPDRFAHEGNPPQAVVRQGSIASLYEEFGGDVFYVGKPHRNVYEEALKHFKLHKIENRNEILMVGDNPETDIRGAYRFGIPSALITETGILAEQVKESSFEMTIQTLSKEDMPNFYISRLGSQEFELHPNLAKKQFIANLSLCQVLMEDDEFYPWIFLVPRRPHVSRLIDLSIEDQLQLTKELDLAQRIMWEEFKPTQLNVAAIGNKTPQLHVHVIARNSNDPAWPGTVWDHPARTKLQPEAKLKRAELLKARFEAI